MQSGRKASLSPDWTALLAKLPKRREGIGLSRLARHASAEGIAPQHIDDAVLESFITAVRRDHCIASRTICTAGLHKSGTKRQGSPGLIFAG